jgi:hypothetical protein
MPVRTPIPVSIISSLQARCHVNGLLSHGSVIELLDRLRSAAHAKFRSVMRKLVHVILFCKHVKGQGNRRALVMHTMLKHIPIQELREKIFIKAKLMRISHREKKRMSFHFIALEMEGQYFTSYFRKSMKSVRIIQISVGDMRLVLRARGEY